MKVKKTKYKLKTNRGAFKRFKKTGTGKYRFRRANRNHIRTKQDAKQVRQGRGQGVISAADSKAIDAMLPNN